MVKPQYIPDRGDIVWLDFNTRSGHEQQGRRPALVLSHKPYNEKIGLGIFCPIASTEKGYPFEVKISSARIHGCVLSDQVKSLDWKIRNIEFMEISSDDVVEEVLEKIKVIIE